MNNELLNQLSIDFIKNKSISSLNEISSEIRKFIIHSTSQTGGHIGANLGTIELTIALHYCFNSPEDAIFYDTGHIGYTHKILTGRINKFSTLNTYKGLSRFITCEESKHDIVEASHAGTSLSLALGRSLTLRRKKSNLWTIAVIGDGSLSEGIALEALNHISEEKNIKMIIILNDNSYAISPGFGAIHKHLQNINSSNKLSKSNIFTELGYNYIGPVDGHSIEKLIHSIKTAKNSNAVTIIHTKTIKGNGFKPALNHPYKMHFSFPFDIKTGEPKNINNLLNFQDIAALTINKAMEERDDINLITPSTLYATGLTSIFEKYPNRCFDPGMEEQHAMTMAVGIALAGDLPLVFYQSTFMQRAFDQLFHDVCFSNKNIILLSVRSGFAGYDNPTHHGIYDLSYTKGLPNLKIYYPRNPTELHLTIEKRINIISGPTLILMPYGSTNLDSFEFNSHSNEKFDIDEPEIINEGDDGIILCLGNKVDTCIKVVSLLLKINLKYKLVNPRRIKPLHQSLSNLIENHKHIVTVEEFLLEGGFGESISSLIHSKKQKASLTKIGLPCKFIEAGSNQELTKIYELDSQSIFEKIITDRSLL